VEVEQYTFTHKLYTDLNRNVGKFSDVVLEKNGVSFGLIIKKCITHSQVRKEYRTYNKRMANWDGNMLHANCLLKHVTEGKLGSLEITERRGHGRDFKEKILEVERGSTSLHCVENVL
jgi:hypothetical protein